MFVKVNRVVRIMLPFGNNHLVERDKNGRETLVKVELHPYESFEEAALRGLLDIFNLNVGKNILSYVTIHRTPIDINDHRTQTAVTCVYLLGEHGLKPGKYKNIELIEIEKGKKDILALCDLQTKKTY